MTHDHILSAVGLSLRYERSAAEVVDRLDLTVPPGAMTIVVGANACGKSTLLRGLARLMRPSGGSVLLDGRAIHDRPTREVATVLGLLPQTPTAPEGITVTDLVGRGRYPHHGWFRRWTEDDDRAVSSALEMTDVLDLADRPVDELSGGQRQRVWIAMALAQDTDILLLDEPTTFLDLPHQVEVLDLLTDLCHGGGATVVTVLHELNLAARYADHLVAMRAGRVVAAGPPTEVVTEELVADVFDLRCAVLEDPLSGAPMIVPFGRHHTRARRPRPAGSAVR
jgi:iron complex transport system ATP-binding protein